jgi:hypothetical protein
MAIKLPNVEHKTVEQLRMERYNQYAPLSLKLQEAIRTICGEHRKAYEDYLYEGMRAKLQRFLDTRLPNETAEEYYKRLTGWDDKQSTVRGPSAMIWMMIREDVKFVEALTDHRKEPKQRRYNDTELLEWRDWSTNPKRSPFQVQKLSNADQRMRKDAEEFVDNIIHQFVRKVTEKVLDILVANPKYECKLLSGRFSCGTFEADVIMTFAKKAKFRMHVMLKDNRSVLGTPYVQYPLTFHDVETDGKKLDKMVPENQILDVMGIKPWKPTKSKKAWLNLGVGDIVELQDGRIGLVVRTKAPAIHLYFDPKVPVDSGFVVEDIKAIRARTSLSTAYDPELKDRDDVHHFEKVINILVVEMFSGRVVRFPLGKDTDKDREEGYQKRELTLRKKGFQDVLAKWDELNAPYEPPPPKKRMRWR